MAEDQEVVFRDRQYKETIEDRGSFRISQIETDYERGKVVILRVIPQEIGQSAEAIQAARKQIFVPGWNNTGRREVPPLLEDLLTLATANKEAGGGQLVTMGVAFVGEREHAREIVPNEEFGFPEGTRAMRLQVGQAQDIVAATQDFVTGNNVEILGHSYGGSLAQIADMLAQKQTQKFDLVGLSNTSGWNKDHQESVVPREGRAIFRRLLQGGTGNLMTGKRALRDRAGRSLEEYWAARHSITYPLIQTTTTPYMVAISSKDQFYSKTKIERILTWLGNQGRKNITRVVMPWDGHLLGRHGTTNRRERLGILSQAMINARPRAT